MWKPFDKGATLGSNGSESGETIRDEEHVLGARITLERNADIAPFSKACGIYGWMVHTRFFSTENEAVVEYDKMKACLSEIVEPFSDPSYDRHATEEAMEAFVKDYP